MFVLFAYKNLYTKQKHRITLYKVNCAFLYCFRLFSFAKTERRYIIYGQENATAIENEENTEVTGEEVVEQDTNDTSEKESSEEETTLSEEDLTEEENQSAAEVENEEDTEVTDEEAAEQNIEDTSVQEEKANDENVSATADNDLSGNCGATENDKVTWELRQNNFDNSNPTYTLVISGSGAMMDEYRPYDDKKKQITEIFIGNGISKIGKGAFWNSQNVTKVTFEENSSLKVIGKNAFHTNTSLITIVLPSSLTIIEGAAFYGDTNLQTVEFENADTLKEIGVSAFGACNNLTYMNNPEKSSGYEWMPKNLTYIGKQAFNGDKLLQGAVTIPAGVTELGDRVFTNAQSISKLSFAQNSQLTSIGINAFRNKKNLKELIIPANVSSVGEGIFYGCSDLNTVIFEEGSKVTNLPRVYGNMEKLVLPDGLKKIENNALSYSSLNSIQLPSALNEIGANAFKGSHGLHSLDMTNVSVDNLIIYRIL